MTCATPGCGGAIVFGGLCRDCISPHARQLIRAHEARQAKEFARRAKLREHFVTPARTAYEAEMAAAGETKRLLSGWDKLARARR